jgi:hypothetical protein
MELTIPELITPDFITQPEDVAFAYEELSKISDKFTIAVHLVMFTEFTNPERNFTTKNFKEHSRIHSKEI